MGGKHVLPMSALTALLERLGCADIRTYIQSGNAIFRASPALATEVPAALRDAIARDRGFDVPVVVRSSGELARVVAANPFRAGGGGPSRSVAPAAAPGSADPKALHVGFLASRPTPAAVAGLAPDRSPPDAFAVVETEVYLYCPGGLARTRLTNAWFDRQLGTTCTIRNWRTTQTLLAMASP